MLLGVFADTHDHLEAVRQAVDVFLTARCELVIFAGDLVSSHAVPPLRRLRCPVVACFGDNEGNRQGVAAGMSLVGEIGEPPFGVRTGDGTRVLLTHMLSQLQGLTGDFDVCIFGHTHRAEVRFDPWRRLYLNPGEASGWTSGRPSVALLQTQPLSAEIVPLNLSTAPISGNLPPGSLV
jgi:hypothetical protein